MNEKLIFISTSGFIEIALTVEQAKLASHTGKCDDDVRTVSMVPEVAAQLEKIDPSQLYAELAEDGAWDEVELQDHAQNLQRILWIAACEIMDEAGTQFPMSVIVKERTGNGVKMTDLIEHYTGTLLASSPRRDSIMRIIETRNYKVVPG